jgi:hypothetical protein
MKRSRQAPAEQLGQPAAPPLAQNERRQFRDERTVAAGAGPSAPIAGARAEVDLDAGVAGAKREDADAHRNSLAGATVVSGTNTTSSGDGPPLAANTRSGVIPESTQEVIAGNDSGLLASTHEMKPAPLAEAAGNEPSKDAAKQAEAGPPNVSSGAMLEESVVTSPRRVRGGKRPAVPNAPAAIAMEKAKHPNPEDWLREIGELRTAGRVEEANRQLEMFRRTYPDHSVPSSAAEPQPPAQ